MYKRVSLIDEDLESDAQIRYLVIYTYVIT